MKLLMILFPVFVFSLEYAEKHGKLEKKLKPR